MLPYGLVSHVYSRASGRGLTELAGGESQEAGVEALDHAVQEMHILCLILDVSLPQLSRFLDGLVALRNLQRRRKTF